ncbi:MAG: diphosphomevalonate decarboxylase [Bacteroidota bacterium]
MTQYTNPDLRLSASSLTSGEIRWTSPSNIALIKYWGKHGKQLPRNPSISFTLKEAYSDTTISWSPKSVKDDSTIDLSFFFEGQANPAFGKKVETFLAEQLDAFPFLGQLSLKISSGNSFPHSAGIASSASAMSAVAMCLCSMENRFFNTLNDNAAFLKKASYFARLGSGSAARSVYPFVAVWGQTDAVADSSDLYAIPFADKVHPMFHDFHDAILIISKEEKSVSSRAGHALMEGNPYAPVRYAQANSRLETLIKAMAIGDLETFGNITEGEALTLHALMMTSEPSFLLMASNSLEAIQRVRAFRADTGVPLYFTLDAGPNLHLLYPGEHRDVVESFIKSDLESLCENGRWIADKSGEGPVKITES